MRYRLKPKAKRRLIQLAFSIETGWIMGAVDFFKLGSDFFSNHTAYEIGYNLNYWLTSTILIFLLLILFEHRNDLKD